MSERLVIRLGSHQQQPVHWLVWSIDEKEIIASGVLSSAHQLNELQERAGGRPIITLLPSCDILFAQVTLPGRYSQRSAPALPYLLEEYIASDVESLHIVVLAHNGSQVEVMAVDQQKMSGWLAWLDEAGLTSTQFLPDILALPSATDGWSALQLGDEWLIRQGLYQGIVVDEPLLATLLTINSEPVTIYTHTPAPTIPNANWIEAEAELPMLLLTKGALESSSNLLSGPYRPSKGYARYWKQWRHVAITAALCLLLVLGDKGLLLRQLNRQEQSIKAEIHQVYTHIFPNETRIINVRSQMEQHLKQLTSPAQEGLLQQLHTLAPSFAQLPTLQIEVLRYDVLNNELRLQLSAPNFSEVEQFRTLISQQFTVQQGEMRTLNGRVDGTLTLKGRPLV